MVCDRIIIMHNGQIRSDGTPMELMQETETDSLEEAYVSLTSDIARADIQEEPETRLAKMWRSLLTPSTKNREVGEDE
jgi:ABC-type multidrug transport system ATPase subunit